MTTIASRISSTEYPSFETLWREFLFNVPMVTKVTEELGGDTDLAGKVLQAVVTWSGTVYTTGRCASGLYNVTGVSLVSSTFTDYSGVIIFALCLVWGLDVLQLNLEPRVADAAFALGQAYQAVPEGNNKV